MSTFSDPAVVSGYAERTARIVPGLRDLHKMASVLMAERAACDARVLVLGAGGGLELKVFAEMQPEWRFDGVDPSSEMLQLARTTLGAANARVVFHQSTIDGAPDGPFDAATCLLTLHFLPEAERLRTVKEVYRRLQPGAPFVVAHHSFPNTGPEQDRWLRRYAAFGAASGVPAAQAEGTIQGMKEHLPVLSPEQDLAVLHQAGFSKIELFYAAFTFRGWVGYKV